MVYKVEAIERDADPQPWEFEFDGDIYTLPSDVDIRALSALEGGRLDDAFRILLGEEQYDRMQESTCIFGPDQLDGLLKAYFDDLGLDLGKQSPSGASSRSMRRRSRPTSSERTE